MTTIENRRLAQQLLDGMFSSARMSLDAAKANLRNFPENEEYWSGQVFMAEGWIQSLELYAGYYRLRVPQPETHLTLAVDNTK